MANEMLAKQNNPHKTPRIILIIEDALSTKLLEKPYSLVVSIAMQSGKPIITTPNQNMKEPLITG